MMFFFWNQMPKSEKNQINLSNIPHPLGPHYEENKEAFAFRNLTFEYHNQENFKQ